MARCVSSVMVIEIDQYKASTGEHNRLRSLEDAEDVEIEGCTEG
jgi:hypothetical protein